MWNLRRIQEEESLIEIPVDWPELEFKPGQEVWVLEKDGIFDQITGIQLDTIDEGDIPPYVVWVYRVGAKWYRAEALSTEQPLQASKYAITLDQWNDVDPFIDSDELR